MTLETPKMTYELAVGAAQVVVQKQLEAEAKCPRQGWRQI